MAFHDRHRPRTRPFGDAGGRGTRSGGGGHRGQPVPRPHDTGWGSMGGGAGGVGPCGPDRCRVALCGHEDADRLSQVVLRSARRGPHSQHDSPTLPGAAESRAVAKPPQVTKGTNVGRPTLTTSRAFSRVVLETRVKPPHGTQLVPAIEAAPPAWPLHAFCGGPGGILVRCSRVNPDSEQQHGAQQHGARHKRACDASSRST